MTDIYLIRHGETELNSKGVYYGWTDCRLNDRGLAQAEELAEILQHVSFDVVISSTLERAVETAVIVSGFSRDGIILDERLREMNFGEWEGMHFTDAQKKYRQESELWCSDWYKAAPPSGESLEDMFCRVKSCIDDITEQYRGKKILIVSHLGSMRIIPLILLRLSPDFYWSFTAEPGRYSLYEIDEKECCIIKRINSRY